MMEKGAATGSSRHRLVWLLCYLLTFHVPDIPKYRCFSVAHTSGIRRNDAIPQPAYDSCCSKLLMSPSLEDAALVGNDFLQVIIDASPIGLPVAGLIAAFVLSKSGIQQREDLRTEVVQVQTNIIKKSEEADLAGKASTVRRVGTILPRRHHFLF